MKKRLLHLFSAFCLMGVAANAEVIQDYEYNFDDESIKNTGYHPVGWGRSHDSGTYSFSEDGRSGLCLTVVQSPPGYYDFYDILIVPPFTGTASIYVKANSADASIKFRKVNYRSTNNKNYWDSDPINDYETPALIVGEWVKVTLPTPDAGTRIGIRVDNASIDDFHADSAEIIADQMLTIGRVNRIGTGSLNGNAEGKFEFEYDIILTNDGDVDYAPGDENYTLSHFLGNTAESIGNIEIPEALAAGESKTMRIKAMLNGGNAPRSGYLRVRENITGTMDPGSGTYISYIPFLPEIKFGVTGTANNYYSTPYRTSEPYAPYLSFGSVYDDTRREKTVTIKNTASLAPLTVTGITAEGKGFSVDFTENMIVNAGESKEFTVKFDGTEPGIYRGTLTLTTAEIGEVVSPLSAAVPGTKNWHEDFEGEGNPAGFILSEQAETGYIVSAFGGEGHRKVIQVGGTAGDFITPKLQVAEGETLLISGYSGYADASFKVEYSSDREEWTEAYSTSSASFDNKFPLEDYTTSAKLPGFVEVTDIPAGDWYVRFSGTYFNIDDLYGFTALEAEDELYLRSVAVPANGKVNTPYEATAEIVNLGSDVAAEDYTVKLYFGEDVFAEAETTALGIGENKTFTMKGMPHDAGEYEARVEIVMGDEIISSETFTVTIGEETAASGTIVVGSNPGSTGNMGPIYTHYMENKESLTETLYNTAYIQKYSTELTAGSKIGSLTYYGKNSGSAFTANVAVYMKNESNDKLGGGTGSATFTDSETMLKVYEGAVTVNSQTGGELMTIQLDEPFTYEGEGISIKVESHFDTSSTVLYYGDRVSGNGCTAYNLYSSFPAGDNTPNSNITTVGFGLAADVAVVSGTVTHAASNLPLADVNITLESPEKVIYRTTTDENGEYTVNVLQPDKQYKVKASKDQLDDYESEGYLDLSGLSATHHFTMTGTMTGVETIVAGSFSIRTVEGGIVISAESDTDVKIHDLLGRQILNLAGFKGERRVELASGIYVINNRKVAVK